MDDDELTELPDPAERMEELLRRWNLNSFIAEHYIFFF